MVFWGVELKADQKLELEESVAVHLSSAALGPDAKAGDKVFINVNVDDSNHVLGSLHQGKNENLSLDTFFDSSYSEVTFSTTGKSSVFLTGYQLIEDEGEDMYGSDDSLEGFDGEEFSSESEDEVPQLKKAPAGKITELPSVQDKKGGNNKRPQENNNKNNNGNGEQNKKQKQDNAPAKHEPKHEVKHEAKKHEQAKPQTPSVKTELGKPQTPAAAPKTAEKASTPAANSATTPDKKKKKKNKNKNNNSDNNKNAQDSDD